MPKIYGSTNLFAFALTMAALPHLLNAQNPGNHTNPSSPSHVGASKGTAIAIVSCVAMCCFCFAVCAYFCNGGPSDGSRRSRPQYPFFRGHDGDHRGEAKALLPQTQQPGLNA